MMRLVSPLATGRGVPLAPGFPRYFIFSPFVLGRSFGCLPSKSRWAALIFDHRKLTGPQAECKKVESLGERSDPQAISSGTTRSLKMAYRRVQGEEVYEPSPAEIEQACQEIRAGWSLGEHRKRAGFSAAAFEVTAPVVKVRDLSAEADQPQE
jgi:hypothetical protein